MYNKEFYPTPRELMEDIFQDVNWKEVKEVLEPSAGKGDMADFVNEAYKSYYENCYGISCKERINVDCIEKDPELQCLLKGKGCRLIHDDFLTFTTYKKYDLIVMNPPFSCGDEHLLHALELQKDGGHIICILNAETIRNPYSLRRKELIRQLEELEADITYRKEAFADAERKTDVEIAVVKVTVPESNYQSIILDDVVLGMKKTESIYEENVDPTALTFSDYIKAAIDRYNFEVRLGLTLIREYKKAQPFIMNDVKLESYSRPILSLYLEDSNTLDANKYVKAVRRKYWEALFCNEKFVKNMTSNLLSEYRTRMNKLENYDFSFYNIRTLQADISKNLVMGIENAIMELFEELTYSHSMECSKNVHYYNGWKTNKAWIIQNKVIIPYMDAWKNVFSNFDPTYYDILKKLRDMELVFNYLSGSVTEKTDLFRILDQAKSTGTTKNIQTQYFSIL